MILARLVPEVLRPKRTDINEIDSNDTNNEMMAIGIGTMRKKEPWVKLRAKVGQVAYEDSLSR